VLITSKEVKMAEQSPGEKEKHYPFIEAARKVMLASVGVMALAQDELEDFVDRLVERGELAEKEGKDLVEEMRAKRKKNVEKAEDEVSKRVHEALERMNIPTKTDIESLSQKISDLSKKVDELKKSQSQSK
jgi:poly(hydroxyalkanoate) granule-associated protein